MNAIAPIGSSGIVPQGMDDAMRLAKAMSMIPELPKHLHNSIGTCLMVVDQAMRWRMSPFAVAQCSFNIGGKMGYEGKLMAAAVESMGAIVGGFDYQFDGKGDDRTITVSAVRTGETKPRTMQIRLGDVKTNNAMWEKQPDQQLVYSGARNWARRWTPAALLGAYAPEEFERPPQEAFSGTTIEHEEAPEPKPDPAPTARDRQAEETYGADPTPKPAPTSQRAPGWKEVVQDLDLALKGCSDIHEVNAFLGKPNVKEARKRFQNEARAALEGVIAAAIGRHARGEPDDAWPGADADSAAEPAHA